MEAPSADPPNMPPVDPVSLFTATKKVKFVLLDDDSSKNLFLENKFVKAVGIADDTVGFHHFFNYRGVVEYKDLSSILEEELSKYRGNIFMSNFGNEFKTNFDSMAKFAMDQFSDQLYESVLVSASVMKLGNIDAHCDDEGVGTRIVIVNCSDEEYNLVFFDKNEKDVVIDKLLVKPWMMYLLEKEAR
jgi:hypothetical protein